MFLAFRAFQADLVALVVQVIQVVLLYQGNQVLLDHLQDLAHQMLHVPLAINNSLKKTNS